MQKNEVQEMLEKILNDMARKASYKEWMSLKEGAAYAGVSYNTFMKYRLLGMKITIVDGIKRISKTEIDRFLNENTF